MPRILVVDDDAALRRITERMLTDAGHEVTTATDGLEALRLLKESPFDLMITDLIMPGMEGLQLLREVRGLKVRPTVLVMSGGGHVSGTEYLEMARLFGAAATLSKPFTKQGLIESVERVLKTS
jgi:CheY-like chemotaxis protein